MAWDEKDFENLLVGIGLGADIANSTAQVNLAEAKLVQLANINKSNIAAKTLSNQQTLDYKSESNFLNSEIANINQEIAKDIAIHKGYDVNVQDWWKLDDKDKSPFGGKSLDSLGLEYVGDMTYKAKVADNAVQQLENNKNLLDLNRQISAALKEESNKIYSLYDEYQKVKDDGRYKGIREKIELERHILKNPDTFALKDADGNIIRYDKDMVTGKSDGVIDDKDMFETNELAKAFVSEKKQTQTGIDYGYWDKAAVARVKTQEAALESLESSTAVTAAQDVLKNAESSEKLPKDDKYVQQVGYQASKFSGAKSDWADASQDTNQGLKNELGDPIIKALKFGKVSEANVAIKGYIADYESITGDAKAKENAIYNIIEELVPVGTDASIAESYGGDWGYGFKAGSGMEKSDFNPENWGWGVRFGDPDKARKRSDHLMGMLNMWKSIDDMYPEYQGTYKTQEELDKILTFGM